MVCDSRSRLPRSLPQRPNGPLENNSIPSRELLICLIIVGTGTAHRGGAEAGAVDSQSNGGLHPGSGQLGSSEDAGRTDGARRKTEDGSRGHGAKSGIGKTERIGVLRGGKSKKPAVDEVEVRGNNRLRQDFAGGVKVWVPEADRQTPVRLPWMPENWFMPEAAMVS